MSFADMRLMVIEMEKSKKISLIILLFDLVLVYPILSFYTFYSVTAQWKSHCPAAAYSAGGNAVFGLSLNPMIWFNDTIANDTMSSFCMNSSSNSSAYP